MYISNRIESDEEFAPVAKHSVLVIRMYCLLICKTDLKYFLLLQFILLISSANTSWAIGFCNIARIHYLILARRAFERNHSRINPEMTVGEVL